MTLFSNFAAGGRRRNGWPSGQHRPILKFQELIVLVADLSPSMDDPFRLAGGRVTTRLGALKECSNLWLTQKAAASRHIQVCVVGFARPVKLWLDWTPLSQLDRVTTTINSMSCMGGYTNIAGALELALDRMAAFHTDPRTRRQPKVLLVTDSAANVSTWQHDPLIERARRQCVPLFTVGISNRRDAAASYDRELLWRMARSTKGRFNTAHSLDELKRALASAS